MDSVAAEVDGLNRLNKQLQVAADFDKRADSVMGDHVTDEAGKLRRKPPPPMLPGQRYIRTGRLGKEFKAEHMATLHWAVTNRVKSLRYNKPYAVWVAKRGMQADIHRNRWWTADEELEDGLPKLGKALAKDLDETMQRQRD